jgi:hypothetical protein
MANQLTNKTKVAIVAAICLLGLVITLKNILRVPAEFLSRDVILYIFIYSLWGILYPTKVEESQNSIFYRPLFWTCLIILMTAGIILVYAL